MGGMGNAYRWRQISSHPKDPINKPLFEALKKASFLRTQPQHPCNTNRFTQPNVPATRSEQSLEDGIQTGPKTYVFNVMIGSIFHPMKISHEVFWAM